jgi:hypothetical protein
MVHSPIETHPQELIDYLQTEISTLISHRVNLCNDSTKVSPIPCFWSHFHVNWYRSVYMDKKTLILPVQWVNYAYMKKKKRPIFNEIIVTCEYHAIDKIMAFKYN